MSFLRNTWWETKQQERLHIQQTKKDIPNNDVKMKREGAERTEK
jgi:hypothetical protein